MKPLFICNVDLDEVSQVGLKQLCSDSPIKNKERIIAYLRKAPVSAYTSAPVADALTGEIISEADNARSDGTYTWYESEIYHFEKYNLKLNDDFIEYVLNRPE